MKFALSAATALGLLGLLSAANTVQAAVVWIDGGAAEAATTPWLGGAAGPQQAATLAAAAPEAGATAVVAAPAPANPALHLYQLSTVPEQSAYTMLLIGLGLLGLHMRRQPQEEKFSVEPQGGSSSLE